MNIFLVFLPQLLETQPFPFLFAKPAEHPMQLLCKVLTFAVGTFVIFWAPRNYALNVKGVHAVSFKISLFLLADAALLQRIHLLFSPNPYILFRIRLKNLRNQFILRTHYLVFLRLIWNIKSTLIFLLLLFFFLAKSGNYQNQHQQEADKPQNRANLNPCTELLCYNVGGIGICGIGSWVLITTELRLVGGGPVRTKIVAGVI